MALSGYLFAKLLDGRDIRYAPFLFNRALRLVPLYVVVLALVALEHHMLGYDLRGLAKAIVMGVVYPSLPNGGWSLTVEAHFYLVLLLLWLARRHIGWLLAVVLAAMALRAVWYGLHGTVYHVAYATLFGRIDQFALGILVFGLRLHLTNRHWLAGGVMAAFALFYSWFDAAGGYYHMPSFPSTHPIWVILPSVEGLGYAVAIAWYDTSFNRPDRGFSRFVARLGEYSYSIYLLHFFVVFRAAAWVQAHVMDISNLYLALVWSALFFVLMLAPAYLSFRCIEAPFLKYRQPYAKDA
jgi:peptidoglycan/LPS O-acetylase OafA/YrhL